MRTLIFFAATALLLSLWWPEQATQNNTADQQTEIRISSGVMRSSNPGVNRSSFSDDVLIHVVEPLVVHRSDLSIAPMAASHYDISEDLKTYRFTLRDGLRFHNGEPVFAAHVKMNWEKILDPATGFQCLPFYNGKMGAKILSVEAIDEQTIEFQLDRPSNVFLEKLAYIQCPVAVLHPDSWDENGRWIKPIATGPFKFSEWKKGRYVLLKKFDDYQPRTDAPSGLAGKKVAEVDQLRFMVITDLMATKAALISGQLDLAGSMAPITALELRSSKRLSTLDHPGLSRRTLLMQTDDPLLSDVRIRQALSHALEMKTFADVSSLGLAEHNPSTIPLSSKNHTDAHAIAYEYNLEKTKALLQEAGYRGEEIVIKTTREEQAYFDNAMIAEAMFKKAGFNIKIEVMELATLLGNYFEGNYQLMSFEYSPRLSAFMNYHTLMGDKKQTPNRWDDKFAKDLLLQAAMATGSQQQLLFDQIHQRMMQEVPVINLYNAPIIDVVSNRLEGYSTWSGVKPRLWNVSINDEI